VASGNFSVVRDENSGEEDLESAVKGIATGIAGKAKEVAGELLDDPDLEDEGIAQQEEGEARRAGNP
jgi:uncharacterized protein YjbJ (UPF0337 family)